MEEARADEQMVISLWKHEIERIFKDPICRYADNQWFDDTINNSINEVNKISLGCMLVILSIEYTPAKFI